MLINIIGIIMIIAEQVLTAGERLVQWEQWVIMVIFIYLTYDMSSRSRVVLSNLIIIWCIKQIIAVYHELIQYLFLFSF